MKESVASKFSDRVYWSVEDVRSRVLSSDLVVFAKGTADKPRCGFSERVFKLIEGFGKSYDSVDVCEDGSIIAALREYAGSEKHLPIIFCEGKLLSSSDDWREKEESGELSSRIEKVSLDQDQSS